MEALNKKDWSIHVAQYGVTSSPSYSLAILLTSSHCPSCCGDQDWNLAFPLNHLVLIWLAQFLQCILSLWKCYGRSACVCDLNPRICFEESDICLNFSSSNISVGAPFTSLGYDQDSGCYLLVSWCFWCLWSVQYNFVMHHQVYSNAPTSV